MTMKATVGSLVALVFSLLILAIPAAHAEAPKYDATGTWNYQISNLWTDCAIPPGDIRHIGVANYWYNFCWAPPCGLPPYRLPGYGAALLFRIQGIHHRNTRRWDVELCIQLGS